MNARRLHVDLAASDRATFSINFFLRHCIAVHGLLDRTSVKLSSLGIQDTDQPFRSKIPIENPDQETEQVGGVTCQL